MSAMTQDKAKRTEKQKTYQDQAKRQDLIVALMVTSFAVLVLLTYLMPMGYAIVTSLKSKAQVSAVGAPVLPSTPKQFEYEGETYPIYLVPQDDGTLAEWALVQPRRRGGSDFVDTTNPEVGLITWEGNWRTLEAAWEANVQWSNYPEAWNFIDFARLLWNTIVYAFVTMIGMVTASAFTAYGFARFRFPGKSILFILVISTLILPPQVTDLPKYAFFASIGWLGTWWPLIVPAFFGHAYHVFLLRQYFLTIPREMEEAAAIDGAGPLMTFFRVILPQSGPALTASALFHFFYAWNDYFGPLIYLTGNRQAQPISVGLAEFNGLYSSEPQLILAASIITMILPLAIFFLAQRVFVQGIVITGVDK